MKVSGSTSSLLLLSLALHHVSSFSVVQPMSSGRFSLSVPSSIQGEHAPSQALRLRTRRHMVGIEEVITPSIILLGAAAASVYANSGQLDFSELTSSFQGSSSSSDDSSSSTAVTTAAAPAATEPEATPAPPASYISLSLTPDPVPAPKSTTNLALEVGSTIEEQRKTNDLVASRQAAAKTSTSTGTAVETVNEAVSRTTSEDAPKSGRKRKFVLKVIKKVIAPWRKWDDIQ